MQLEHYPAAEMTANVPTSEARLIDAAKGGGEQAFAELVQPYRRELHAHCYRMLGSVQDAEDALQEGLLRAWRGLAQFEGRSTLRSWLYTIATNTCLSAIKRRPKRMLPIDYGPSADPTLPPGEPVVESVWIEPYPDEMIGLQDGFAAPEASYEQRESVELAFVAALQHVPASQRAVLILREVLGYSAKEVAQTLDTSVASVNSALQRARAAVEQRIPERTQQATLRALGDEAIKEIVERYVQAWERCDVDAFATMLAEDASFTMPPLASWYRGREEIATWARAFSMAGGWRWRAIAAKANGQLALGFYAWHEPEQIHRAFALNVLSLRGELVSDVTAFIARSAAPRDRAVFARYPDEPVDPVSHAAVFTRFGLPERIEV